MEVGASSDEEFTLLRAYQFSCGKGPPVLISGGDYLASGAITCMVSLEETKSSWVTAGGEVSS